MSQMIFERRCVVCHGQGTISDTRGAVSPRTACPVCMGRGHNLVPRDAQTCAYCRGNGRLQMGGEEWKVCPDCQGIGSVW